MNLNPFIDLIFAVIEIYKMVLIGYIIISWLISFDIINRFNPIVAKVSEVLYKLTEPALRRIRRYMPDLGGIDISPIVLFLILYFIRSVLFNYFYRH